MCNCWNAFECIGRGCGQLAENNRRLDERLAEIDTERYVESLKERLRRESESRR